MHRTQSCPYYDFRDQAREFSNGDVAADADIEVLFARVMLEDEDACNGQIIGEEEFPPRSPRSPHHDAFSANQGRFMETPHKCCYDMAIFRMIIVPKTIKVCWHYRDVIGFVLPPQCLTKFDSGDFCDRIPLVCRFERSGEERTFDNGLVGEPRINAP